MRSIRAVGIAAALPAIFAATAFNSSLAAQSVTYSQGSFVQSDWDKAVLSKSGGIEESVFVNFGGSTWQANFDIPANVGTTEIRVAEINRFFTYDPAVLGALISVSFSFDVFGDFFSGLNTPFFGGYRPVLRQNGKVFSVAGSDVLPTASTWTSHSWNFLGTSNWVAPIAGDLALPDFSATGSMIEFGWRGAAGTSCPTSNCRAASFGAQLDNYSVTARGTNTTVPEPSSLALMAAGLAATMMVVRRRRTPRL